MRHLETTVDSMAIFNERVMPALEEKLMSVYNVALGRKVPLPTFATYAEMPNLTQGSMNPLIFAIRFIPDTRVCEKDIPGIDHDKHYCSLQVSLVTSTEQPPEEMLLKGIHQTSVVCGIYNTQSNLIRRAKFSPGNIDNIPVGLVAATLAECHAVLDTMRKYVSEPDFNLVETLSVKQPITEGTQQWNR